MKRLLFLFISLLSIATFIFANPNSSRSSRRTATNTQMGASATPDEIRERLAALNCDIELRYTDEVQSCINTYLNTSYGRKRLSSMIGELEYYLPIFDHYLEEAGIPMELKYLAVIESALDPKATSHCGAAGLWQFMPIAAKGYDMKITSSIDERRDPYISSHRACQMLKELYKKFGDWTLAIAAYNCGGGRLQQALNKAGGDKSKHNFWTIAKYLPAQTRNYVPKFIAMTYLMSYYKEHDITVSDEEMNTLATDTVHITGKMTFREVAAATNVSIVEIKKLNPHYRGEVIPATTARPCNLILPTDHAMTLKQRFGRPAVATTKPAKNAEPINTVKSKVAESNQTRERKNTVSAKYVDRPSSTSPNTMVRIRVN